MKQTMDTSGAVLHSVREYDIAPDTVVRPFQVVKVKEGLVVVADAAETGPILGYAAEGHSGVVDALNMRSNGEKILVHDSPSAIAESPVPTFAATGGGAKKVNTDALGAFSAGDFTGGYLKLIGKGAGSTNPDPVGTLRRVSGYTYTATGTVSAFTVDGGAGSGGDTFELYPPIGFAKGNLDASRSKLDLSAVAQLPIKVVGKETGTGKIRTVARYHQLGNESL